MTSIITVEEIQAIFDEADRLKAKGGGGGGGNSVETRVSILTLPIRQTIMSLTAGFYLNQRASMAKKSAQMKIFFFNTKTNLNNHEDNKSKPYYVVSLKPTFFYILGLCRRISRN